VEKIYNSDGIKVQENYYDYVTIDGAQRKQIAKTCYYNRRGALKKAITYKDNQEVAVYRSKDYNRHS
jgi:hypothetical protein